MLVSTSTVLTAFAGIAAALPASNLAKRAGGPAVKPIPSTCAITNPAPTAPASFSPAPATDSVLLYSAYYPSFSSNKTLMAEQCLQQCYGYGNSTECKAAYWAENVKVPAGYYGSPGGQLETACLFYTRPLTSADFEASPEGQGTDAYSRNLAC